MHVLLGLLRIFRAQNAKSCKAVVNNLSEVRASLSVCPFGSLTIWLARSLKIFWLLASLSAFSNHSYSLAC